MYRNLAPKSKSYYRDGLFDPIALLLRYRHVASLGKVDYGQTEIDLHLEKRVMHAVVSLYNFLIKVPSEEEIPRVELAVHVHRVLVHLLTSQAPSSERVGGPLDFVMVLRSYIGPEQGFGPPTIASRYCCMLQYGLRTIVVHIARLGGGENAYKIEEPAPTTEQPQETAVDSSSSKTGIPLTDLEDCDPLDIGEGELDQLMESEEAHGPIPSILKDSLLDDAAPVERILDPFLADVGDEENGSISKDQECSEVPDFTSMKKDNLLA